MVNVYFSLAEECLLSQKDISLLPETWEQISERFPKHSLALLEKLKEQAGIPSGEGSDIPAGEGSDIPVGKGSDIPAGKGSDIPAGEGSSFPAGKELEALRQAFPHTEMKDFALAHDFLSSPSSREAEVPAGEAKEEPLASDASQERAWQNAEENALGSSLGATLFSALQGFDEILPEGLKESIDSPQATSEPEKEEDPSEAPPEEASPICLQAEDGSRPGYIYQSSWMQEKGSIYSYDDLAFYSFVFKDTEEPLRKALACAKPQDLKEKPIAVRFIKAGKNAKKIVLEQNPLEVALGLIRLRKDCEVLKEAYPLMKESRSRNLPGDDLVAYLQKVVAYHKKYGPEDKEILEQAKQFYDASWDKVQKVWPKISSLVQFQLALENTSKAISLLQTVLENFPLAIGEKLERRKELCRLLSQEYDRTKDLSYALELTRQAENYRSDFDVSDFQTRSNQSYLDFYWKSSSLYEAQAYMNLKNPDEALQAVKRLSSQTLSDEEKSRLGVVRSWLRSKGLLEPSPKAPGEKGGTENGPAGAQEAREEAGPSPDKASLKEEAAVEESSPGESQGEARPQDYDHSGLADLGMTAQDIFQLAMERRGNLRLPLLLCTLKAGASLDPSLEPAYRAASLAVANPMEDLDLNAGNLLTMFGEIKGEHQDFMEGCLACATLRSAFANEDSFSYHLTALRDSIGLFSELDSLSEVFRYLLEFRRDCQLPMDELAAYHGFDQGVVHSRLALAQEEGRRCYEKYICGAQDGDGLKTLFYTKMLLYAEDGPVGKPLRLIAGKDYDSLLALKKEFMDRWIEGSTISEDAISQKAILNFFDECWRQGQIMDNNRSKSFKLQGQRKNNVCQSIQACLAAVARCFVALDFQPDMEEQQILAYYHRLLPGLMGSLRTLEQDCARLLSQVPQGQKNTSCFLLSLTASQIRQIRQIRHVAELNQEQVMTLMEELLDLNILRPDSNTTYTFASSNFRTLIGNEEEISEKLVKIDEEDWE